MLLSGEGSAVHAAQHIIAFACSAIVMHIDSRVDSDEFTNCDQTVHLMAHRPKSVSLSQNFEI